MEGCSQSKIEEQILQFAFDSRPAATKVHYAKDRDYYTIERTIRHGTWLKADLYIINWPGSHQEHGCVVGVDSDKRIFEVLNPFGTRELPLNRVLDATKIRSRSDVDSLLLLYEELYGVVHLRYMITRKGGETAMERDLLPTQIAIDSCGSAWEATFGLVTVNANMSGLDTSFARVVLRMDSRLRWVSELRRSITMPD